jgi:hypothetical protein
VKRLHHRDSSLAARAIYGRRNHHKCIVNVHNIRFFALEKRPEVVVRVAGPDGSHYQGAPANGREFLDLMIAPPVRYHLVPAPLQDSLLLLEYNIFAAWLLIFVMDQQYFHDRVCSQMTSGVQTLIEGKRLLFLCNHALFRPTHRPVDESFQGARGGLHCVRGDGLRRSFSKF